MQFECYLLQAIGCSQMALLSTAVINANISSFSTKKMQWETRTRPNSHFTQTCKKQICRKKDKEPGYMPQF